jgi:MFS family permease
MFAFAFGTMSDSMEGGLINTLFPVIAQALSLELGALGTLSSISRFARMIFGTLWAIVGDKYGRKLVLVVMTGFWGLWTAAAGFAQNFTQLLILYTIGVIGTVAAEPIQNGLMVDMFDEDERGKAYGTLRTIGVAGSIILTPLIGQLANWPTPENGWRIGLFIMGGLSLISGILLMIFLKEPPRRVVAGDPDAGKFKMSDIKEIAKIPSFWLMAIMLIFVTSLVFFAFMVTFFVTVRGWETSSAAILYTVFMAGFALGGLTGGALGDLFQRKFGDKGRVMFMQIYLVSWAVMIFLFTQIDWGVQTPISYVIAFLTGLIGSWGFSGSVLPMVGQMVEPQYAATTFALLFSFFQGLITAIYLLLIGPLVELLGGLDKVLLYMVVVPYVINALFWTLFYFTYPKDVRRRKERMGLI